LIVSVTYLAVILQVNLHGEGGILALTALATSKQRKAGPNRWLLPLGLFGAALLLGDSMITPAMSVLSAVEGVEVVQATLAKFVVPACVVILFALFLIQSHGTERIGRWFGPIMLCWFFVLAALGIASIWQTPAVLQALNPVLGVKLLTTHPGDFFFILGAVFLAVTGGEALYADMGHFGAQPIRIGWFTVAFPALVFNYLGQGALLLRDPAAADNPLFRLAPDWFLYPLLALATAATIIASQAVISGAFSLLHQSRELGYAPRIQVVHYSNDGEGKVYVPMVNWCLAAATILLVITFRSSDALAGAYGMAVSGTMFITTILAVVCFRRIWKWSWWAMIAVAAGFLLIDCLFFTANLAKFVDGGWLPLLVAAVIYLIFDTWRRARRVIQLGRHKSTTSLDDLRRDVRAGKLISVPGTAVYFTSDPAAVPITLLINAQHNHILHEQVVLLTMTTEKSPRIAREDRLKISRPAPGFIRLVAHYGFMQTPQVRLIMQQAVDEKIFADTGQFTFFVRSEEVHLSRDKNMFRWRKRLFVLLNRNTQDATSLWNIPPEQTIGLRMSTVL
jgi:KUP system potassium uptake protein